MLTRHSQFILIESLKTPDKRFKLKIIYLKPSIQKKLINMSIIQSAHSEAYKEAK